MAVNGYFSTDIEYKGKSAHAKLYVINSNRKTENLLFAVTAQALGLI